MVRAKYCPTCSAVLNQLCKQMKDKEVCTIALRYDNGDYDEDTMVKRLYELVPREEVNKAKQTLVKEKKLTPEQAGISPK